MSVYYVCFTDGRPGGDPYAERLATNSPMVVHESKRQPWMTILGGPFDEARDAIYMLYTEVLRETPPRRVLLDADA